MESDQGGKDFKERTLRSIKEGIGRLWRRKSVNITEYDPTYKVFYLGNVLTGWAKGEGCVEKPLVTLWKNYQSSIKPEVQMKVTVCQSGLKAVTKEHGLTEYWAHRVTFCTAPHDYPGLFCWVYRHEGRRLKQELRCHAVLCPKESIARRMCGQLRARLAQALVEFKRDKLSKQNARLSLANSVYDNPSLPRRKILLSTGGHNYRPPLERSKSAPKLVAIEETAEEDEEIEVRKTSLPDRVFVGRPKEGDEGGEGDDEDQVELDPLGDDHSRWEEDPFCCDDSSSEGSSSVESGGRVRQLPDRPNHHHHQEDEEETSLISIEEDSSTKDSEVDSDESGFVEPEQQPSSLTGILSSPPSLPRDDKTRDLPHTRLLHHAHVLLPTPCLQV